MNEELDFIESSIVLQYINTKEQKDELLEILKYYKEHLLNN